MATPLGYTTRSNVEKFQGTTYANVTDGEFNNYIAAAEGYINKFLGYVGRTTLSGMLTETITREKVQGKVDNYGNLVVDVRKPPVNFDSNGNPLVTLLEFNFGSVRIPLQLTDGSTNALNSVLEVPEYGNQVIYPSMYFMPYLSTITPTAKVNLYNLKDVKFWVDISYTGGYATIPYDIQQATNLLVADMIAHRNNPNSSLSYRQGSYSEQFLPTRSDPYRKGMPVSVAVQQANNLLQPYLRVTW